MRNKAVQMSLFDIYNGVLDSIEEKKPKLITLLPALFLVNLHLPFTVEWAESIFIILKAFCAL